MTPRVPLYDRLPEIYRIKDEEGSPPFQLKAFLAAVEQSFSAIDENIEALYHDLFIDTCADWVVPYIADLVGSTHLKGEPRTLRADVADTIALRRRKGTRLAIERLAANLTGWAARCVELRENLGWQQHLNHLRPDFGGASFYAQDTITRFVPRRGGTVPLRDPARLSLLGTPFDEAAYTTDVKVPDDSAIHYNLPNLAIFLWRLEDYRVPVLRPLIQGVDTFAAGPGAQFVVLVNLHPLSRAIRLFNTYRHDPHDEPPRLTAADEAPGPILSARLNSHSEAGNPGDYVGVDTFDPNAIVAGDLDVSEDGIQIFLPDTPFSGVNWTFRGDNLCAWAAGLKRPVDVHEIVIDPVQARMAIGVDTVAERDALTPIVDGFARNLLVGFTYGAVGPVGAHPIPRDPAPDRFQNQPAILRVVDTLTANDTLETALENLDVVASPVVIEIRDSLVHDLDISGIPGTSTGVDGPDALELNRSLIIRAATGHRPIVRLAQPLRFRPVDAAAAGNERLIVRLEGLYLTRGPAFPADEPLIARTAVAALEVIDSTLDPRGFLRRNGTRTPIEPSMRLDAAYGFALPADETAFLPTPRILLQRSISGPLLMNNQAYRLDIEHSIVDGGRGVADETDDRFAIGDETASDDQWGPELRVVNATFFGRVRVGAASGSGGIWVHRLEVLDNQTGCIKYSYVRGDQDRLPQNHACVTGASARLRFSSEIFEQPAYGQLSRGCDPRILTRGPGDNEMGAFGAVNQEAHKWANLSIRLREFMPIAVRPLLLPVT